MQPIRRLLTLAALAAALTAASTAMAGSPTQFLESKHNKLDPLLANTSGNEKKIARIVNQMLDFPTLCKDSLGKHWEERSKAERKEFTETLHALIEKNVINRLADTRDHTVSYQSEEITGNRASVVTIVSSGDGPRAQQTEIMYKLRKNGNKWIVVDMVTDGVSLVSNYRSQFHKIITQDGWATLMQKMKDKLAEQ
ncbi:MAG: ABC transporter substrate-binding protein [Polyangia bacterium]